ncbi:lysis system i-spanin subunit Rz [Xylophilus sp.]|uniref:lysis system i-spanin subunit Rz n=1 Tax=Xylophilus sp. TaxID=2653893 RepID=UPI002D803CAA|nr:lysis system i-spanin subunit Rz [Xylophilus sp.]
MSPLRVAAWVAGVALLVGAYSMGHHQATAEGAAALAAYQRGVAQDAAREASARLDRYHAQAVAFDITAHQFTEDQARAKADSDRVAADLRAGNLRLRDRWATQVRANEVAIAARAGDADAAPDDRAASAGRIVRAAAECDAQVRGLQSILSKERE